MKTLDRSNDKIQKIGDKLRNEVLEPAKIEAAKILEEAKLRAEAITTEARAQAELVLSTARAEAEKERNVLQSSLVQAAAQSKEALKQSIEEELFSRELVDVIESETVKNDVVAALIKAIISAVEKEGLASEFEVLIPKLASVEEINALIGDKMLKRLKEGSVKIGGFKGGAQVKLVGNNMTIVMTEETLRDLLAEYLRKDYRKLLFGGK